MKAAILSPSDHLMTTQTLADLIVRQVGLWQGQPTKSSKYPTNLKALHYAIDLNGFQMCEIDNIVVLGLRDPGTVEQLRANQTGDYQAIQGLTANQKYIQNVALTQLGMAQIIRDHIKRTWRNQEEPSLYICDEFLRESNKSILEELDFTMIGRHGLSKHINQNTLVYAVNMDDRELQMCVDFGWQQDMVPPAAVITQIMNGALDVDLSEKYWLTPLLKLSLESPPSLRALSEGSKEMGSGPVSQLPSNYDDWVELRESYSQQVLKKYFEQADAHNKAMNTYLSDPMTIMLCRKDQPTPPVIEKDRQK